MVYGWLARLLSVLLLLWAGSRGPERDKDMEILLLRYQLHMLQRRLDTKPRPLRREKLVLATVAVTLKRLRLGTDCPWGESILLFTPRRSCAGIGS